MPWFYKLLLIQTKEANNYQTFHEYFDSQTNVISTFLKSTFHKIQGLSDFDKVVGGLVWCIEVCNVDIDVDLLFEEDSSIGKKIALTVSNWNYW